MICILTSCQQAKGTIVVLVNDSNLKLENGVLFYNNSKFSGSIEWYHDNSEKLKSSANYKLGSKHGIETFWYKNDSVAAKRFYTKGLKTGTHEASWPNGNRKFVYHFNEKGEYHGNIKEWYKTGNVFRDFNYVNGKEVGSQRLWYQNRKIKANYVVVNGERFGLIGLKKCYRVSLNSDEIR